MSAENLDANQSLTRGYHYLPEPDIRGERVELDNKNWKVCSLTGFRLNVWICEC